MGGCVSRDHHQYNLVQEEEESLRKLFNSLFAKQTTALHKKILTKPAITQDTFVSYFKECPKLAKSIYKWARQTTIEKDLTEDVFIRCMEVFLIEPKKLKNHPKNYQLFEKIEVLAWIHFELYAKSQYQLDIDVCYSEAWNFFKSFLEILTPSRKLDHRNKHDFELSIKILMDTIFTKAETTQIGLTKLLGIMKTELLYINILIKNYFRVKLLKNGTLPHPKMIGDMKLLNDDIYSLLYMSSAKIQNLQSMRCIYYGQGSSISFSDITNALTHYDAPSMILIKCLEAKNDAFSRVSYKITDSYVPGIKEKNDSSTYNIIGFYFSMNPNVIEASISDQDLSLFSIVPRLNILPCTSRKPLIHVHTEGIGNKGIGIGGKSVEDCRIWLDGDILNSSYVDGSTDCGSYANGHLISLKKKKIQIEEIEIWGLGSEEAWRAKLERSQRKEEPQKKSILVSNLVSTYQAPLTMTTSHVPPVHIDTHHLKEKTSSHSYVPITHHVDIKPQVHHFDDDDIMRTVSKYSHHGSHV